MHKLLTILVLIALLMIGVPAEAATSEAIHLSVEYTFGKEIVFSASLPASQSIKQALFFLHISNISKTISGEALATGAGELVFNLPLDEVPLRAFSTVEYWLEITSPDGQISETPHSTFYYEDNRFQWRVLQDEKYRVHWYEGDTQFAQTILDAAELGLQNIQSLLPVVQDNLVDIYVYASAQEMRGALQITGQSWVGAHADPDLNVMVVSLPAGPEQRLEIERQVPHELMHILLFQHLGLGYANLPVWLNEGLGSVAELYPNPDYLIPLERASQKKELLPLQSLCREFPHDMSGALLAYAQATSFTRYLHQQYGSSGLESLVQSYADGLDCERGIQVALEGSLTQLERSWRSDMLGENALTGAVIQLLPWLVLFLAAVVLPLVLAFTRPARKAA